MTMHHGVKDLDRTTIYSWLKRVISLSLSALTVLQIWIVTPADIFVYHHLMRRPDFLCQSHLIS